LVKSRPSANRFPLLLLGSIGFHALAFLFFRFHFPQGKRDSLPFLPETDAFSLVNLEIQAPAEPPRPVVEKVEKKVQEITEETETPVEAEPEGEVQAAETLVPVETAPAVSTAVAPAAAGAGKKSRREAADAGAAEYVRRNFDYIQRRVRDFLKYPAGARKAGVQGAVQVAFTIGRDGGVSDLEVRKSSGHDALDQAALEAVRKAAPFRKPPAEARVVLPVSFKLK